MLSAHVVRKKGNENEEAARIIKDIEKMGLSEKIIVKQTKSPRYWQWQKKSSASDYHYSPLYWKALKHMIHNRTEWQNGQCSQ